ncbi:MAG TPA: hypothetical protein VJ905_00505, partial [Halalkalibaculum sp.]|nr:hypothetical protein [Halalkalibaculum sp.]
MKRILAAAISSILFLALGLQMPLFAQSTETQQEPSHKDLPLDAERSVSLNTAEGTWLSLDVHPSG